MDFADIDFSSILSTFHEGVLITDADGVILYYNEMMGKIDDQDPGYPIGKKIVDVYDLTENQSTTMRCLKSGQPIVNEPIFYRTRLGKITNAISNIYPIYKDNCLKGAISFTKDYYMIEKIISSSPPMKSPKNSRDNGTRFSFSDIVGSDSDLSEAVRIARMAAKSPSPIMLAGKTGTGKELFAQSAHNHSSARKNKFIPINCAAIPENLLEGILFGTSRGAFTGAVDKAGLFEEANGGTLFLDEVNSMPLALQAKLLRVIQEKKVRRIGSLTEVRLNLKLISSVNEDPHEAITNGHLRLDLFYRLGVVFIHIPPLSQRERDLHRLVRHFIEKFNVALGKRVQRVSDDVMSLFRRYHWPGNVRELEHVIEGSMNLVDENEAIQIRHLPLHILRFAKLRDKTGDASAMSPYARLIGSCGEQLKTALSADHPMPSDPHKTLAQAHHIAEMDLIRQALITAKGNVAKATRILGLSSPQALHYKMKKYNLDRNDFL